MLLSCDDVSQPPCGVTVNVSVVMVTILDGSLSFFSSLIRHKPLAVFIIDFSEKLE